MSDPLISQTLGNYEIVSKLGKGGMATVYRARQVTMQRDVAIKVMSADLSADPEFVARFEREAHVIARLEHPRILPVHDFGHEGELFYLVMRLVEGESLYYRLKRGPLPLKTAARFVGQIGEALDYAHAEGVIHRDLKPNNILIDQWDNLYLMDFGLAKMLASAQSLTQSGTVLGTPAYMAPEQAEMSGLDVDTRADVYSLGVLLYELLTGAPPFSADELQKAGWAEMQRIIREVEPIKPSTRVGTLGAKLPSVAARRRVEPRRLSMILRGDLDWISMKCLEKDRARRYATANDLAADVRRHLSGEPVVAAPRAWGID